MTLLKKKNCRWHHLSDPVALSEIYLWFLRCFTILIFCCLLLTNPLYSWFWREGIESSSEDRILQSYTIVIFFGIWSLSVGPCCPSRWCFQLSCLAPSLHFDLPRHWADSRSAPNLALIPCITCRYPAMPSNNRRMCFSTEPQGWKMTMELGPQWCCTDEEICSPLMCLASMPDSSWALRRSAAGDAYVHNSGTPLVRG